jgi:hypothetical protein
MESFPVYELPSVENLDIASLEKYIEDDSEFIDFFQEISYIKKFNARIQELKNECQQMAKFNLTLEDKVKQAKVSLNQCEGELAPIQSEYERLKEQQNDFLSRHGTQAVLAKLKQLVSIDEQECAQLVQKTCNLEQFIEEYKEKRKRIHLRHHKIEQLSKIS